MSNYFTHTAQKLEDAAKADEARIAAKFAIEKAKVEAEIEREYGAVRSFLRKYWPIAAGIAIALTRFL